MAFLPTKWSKTERVVSKSSERAEEIKMTLGPDPTLSPKAAIRLFSAAHLWMLSVVQAPRSGAEDEMRFRFKNTVLWDAGSNFYCPRERYPSELRGMDVYPTRLRSICRESSLCWNRRVPCNFSCSPASKPSRLGVTGLVGNHESFRTT
ncbi:hypothetical protein B0H19DRAFT_688449 [Mycena capillaripes]|nr:hypothetical protein B0H19DRAFT_688449 [Mycena capillaripes]